MPSIKGEEEALGKQNVASYMPKAGKPNPAENLLPVPVQQGAGSDSCKRKQKKNARIGGGLKVYWANFRKRIGTGTAPSTTSMVGDGSATGSSNTRPATTTDDEKEEVDEIVVDRTWSEEIKSSVAHSEAGMAASPEKSNGHHQPAETSVDHESLQHYEGFWALSSPLVFIRWRCWPLVMEFFASRFFDQKSEERYQKENWFMRKVCVWQRSGFPSLILSPQPIALWSSVFFIINWVLGCAFIAHPLVLIDKIFFYGVAPACTIPIVFMVMYDFPRDRQNSYQIVLCCATWSW
jgi:osomolarity two-component system sensor histidine kinase SLN1